MKRKKFEERYAARSGITVEQGYESGIFPAIKCECWDEGCEGWRRRYEDDGPAPGKKCKRHAYGGFQSGGWDEEPTSAARLVFGPPRGKLICRWCGESYIPQSAWMTEPIGKPIYDCPHPVFGPSRWDKDDPFIRACEVCGATRRFTPVPCIGGPKDGTIEPTLIGPEDGTSVGSWRIMASCRFGADGVSKSHTYTLRWGPDGTPRWEGRSQAERAQDSQAEITA